MKSLMLIATALLVVTSSARAYPVLVDDFTTATLDPAWVISDLGGTRPMNSYDVITANVLNIRGFSGTGAHRSTLLRSDRSLDVGETLLTDLGRRKANTYTGLMITPSASVTDRANSIFLTLTPVDNDPPNDGVIVAWAIDGADLDANTSSGSATLPDLDIITKMYITRLSASTYEAGYVTASGSVSLLTTTIDSGINPGAAIGYYADMRANQWVEYDNLTITPEPATMILLGLGSLLVIRRKRA